jgi:putative spermidine/putrescine transport system permease protein
MNVKPRLFSPFVAFIVVTLLFLIGPLFAVIPISFTPDSYLSFPTEGASLRHYEAFFTDMSWIKSTGQSLVIAVLSALIATVAGTAAAIGLSRLSGPTRGLILALALLPLVTPAIISALAFYRGWVAAGLFDSWTGTILAHAILAIPFVVLIVSSAQSRTNPQLELAARSLGASWWTTQWRVVIPSLKPGIAGGALFSFVVSWDEVIVTIFITSRSVVTLPRLMWDTIRDDVSPKIAVIATIMIVLTAIIILFATIRSKKGGSQA